MACLQALLLLLLLGCGKLDASSSSNDQQQPKATFVSAYYNKLYAYFQQGENYQRAIGVCQRNGMRLVRIRSAEELELILSKLDTAYAFWLGMQTGNQTVPSYYEDWSDLTLTDAWASDEPSDPVGKECVSLVIYQGLLSVAECNSSYVVLCEKDLDRYNLNAKLNQQAEAIRSSQSEGIEAILSSLSSIKESLKTNNVEMVAELKQRQAMVELLGQQNQNLSRLVEQDPERALRASCESHESVQCQQGCGQYPDEANRTVTFCQKYCICFDGNDQNKQC